MKTIIRKEIFEGVNFFDSLSSYLQSYNGFEVARYVGFLIGGQW